MFYLKSFFFLFRNGYFHNVILTFTNVVKHDLKNDNVVSTLSIVVHINVEIHNVDWTFFGNVNSHVEIHNVVSILIWRCPTLQRDINQKATLKQRWNVSWYALRKLWENVSTLWPIKNSSFKKSFQEVVVVLPQCRFFISQLLF